MSLSSSNSIRTCIKKIPIFLTSKKRNRKKSLTNQRSSPILQKSFSAINFPNFFAFAKGYCPPGYFFSPFLLILHIRSWKSAVHPSLAFPFLKNKKKGEEEERKKERKKNNGNYRRTRERKRLYRTFFLLPPPSPVLPILAEEASPSRPSPSSRSFAPSSPSGVWFARA